MKTKQASKNEIWGFEGTTNIQNISTYLSVIMVLHPKRHKPNCQNTGFWLNLSTLFKEIVQYSQTMVFNWNLLKGTVQADMHAFIHHKCFKSNMIFLISQKMYITYMYGASQQLAKPWKNLFKSRGDTKHIHMKKISMSGTIKILEYKLNYI
jgi:hypothetical protein